MAQNKMSMENLLKQLKDLVWVGTIVAGVVVWVFLNLATIPWVQSYVNQKHAEVMIEIKAIHSEIVEMKKTAEVTDQRVWEMSGRKGPVPKDSF